MKKTLALILTFIMVLALVPTVAFAAGNTIYVDANSGNDATGDGTQANPYATVGKAAAEAATGDTIMLGEGEYTLYDVCGYGANKSTGYTAGKDLTFVGKGEKTIWQIGADTPKPNNGEYNSDYSFQNSESVTFKNMTLRTGNTGVDADYLGFSHTKITNVENCIMLGRTAFWGYTSATFKNTTFNCPDGSYALWTYSSPTMTFDNCTFNSSGKVINVYTDYSAGKYDITVNFNNCTVNNTGAKLKPVLNINDSNMDGYKYILNITGDNKVTGVDVDNITCSRLFGFGGKPGNNTGRSDVTINGVKVWKKCEQEGTQKGERACAHNGVVFTTGSYNGDTTTQYTDGYKDDAFIITKDDTLGYVKKCIYCGYMEPFYGELSNEIGLERTVMQGQKVEIETTTPKDTYKVNGSSGITVDYTATMDMTKLKWEKKGSLSTTIPEPWQMLATQPGQIDGKTEVILNFTFDKNIDLGTFKTKYEADKNVLNLVSNMFEIADGGVQFDIENRKMTIKCKWNWSVITGTPNSTITLKGNGLPVKANWEGSKIDITNSGCVSGTVHIKNPSPKPKAKAISGGPVTTNVQVQNATPSLDTIQIPIVGGCKTDEFTLYYGGGSSGDSGHSHYYYPTTPPVPVIVIPPKTGDMTVWQSILHFLGIR